MENVFVKCPKCGDNVAEKNLRRHEKKAHSIGAELQREVRILEERERKRMAELLKTKVKCSMCSALVTLGGMKSHFGSKHVVQMPDEYYRMLGESPPASMFKSNRAREAYWRSRDLDPSSEESTDLFERTKVLQGGAYGLGKNRKH